MHYNLRKIKLFIDELIPIWYNMNGLRVDYFEFFGGISLNRNKFLKLVSACLFTTLCAVGIADAMKNTNRLSADTQKLISDKSNISY